MNNLEDTLDITIAIPTYNGAKRIPLVFKHLRQQINTEDLRWELLVVDNNSQDNTAEIVKQHQSQWPEKTPLRYCFEPRQGAAFARQKAVREANGKLVGFLDDDNLPEKNWISEAVRFSKQYPQAGAFSGRIYGCYETPPPEGFEKIQAFLAIRDHGSEVISFKPKNLQLPPAASLVISKRIWLKHVPEQPTLTGKIPGLFIQGDDYEPLIHIHKGGWEILYNPNLQTQHKIPANRFKRQYLLELARGCGLATYKLKCIKEHPLTRFYIFHKILLGNIRRLLIHWLNHGKIINQDIEAAMLWEFYLGSFLSPFIKQRKHTENENTN